MPDPAYAPAAQEFTPELSKSYLSSLMTGIDDQGRIDEGRATAEQAARGTLGQQTDDSAIGAVRTGVRNQKASAIGAFNLDVANKQFSERMTGTQRGWSVEDRNFGAAEAEKDRSFKKEMAQLGYQFDDASARRDNIQGLQGAITGYAGKTAIDLGVMGLMMSDVALKKNIVAVGHDGPLTVYEFEYRDDMGLALPAGVQRGFMAQEVEKIFPAAVSIINRFKAVDYACVAEALR